MNSGAVSTPQAISLALQGAGTLLGVVFVSLINFNVFSMTISLTALPLIMVYLWPFKAHYVWSIWLVVLLGLVQDCLSNGPLGLWALVNLLMFLLIEPQERKPGGRLMVHWLQFTVLAMITGFAAYGLGRVSIGQWPSFQLLAAQIMTAILVFPIICRIVNITGYRRRISRKVETF